MNVIIFLINLFIFSMFFVMIKSKSGTSIDDQLFIGIDFGSEFIKASVFSTTTGKSTMVENLESKTNSINLFMLDSEKLYYGQEAYFKQMKYPNSSFTYINDFINTYEYTSDKKSNDCLDKTLAEGYLFSGLFNKNSYFCNESGDIIFEVKFGKNNYKLSLQAILAIQINFILDLATNTMKHEISKEESFSNLIKKSSNTNSNIDELLENEISKRFKGVVFAYPDCLNYHKSKIIREAFEIINKIKPYKLLGIVSNLDSISYYYATEYLIYNNENINSNVNIGFVDIGSSKTKIGYYNYELDKNTNQISIKHLKSATSNFAGRTIENELFNIYDKNNNLNFSHRFRSYPYIQKYKEILSANKITDYNILSVTGKFERDILYTKLSKDLAIFEDFLKMNSINLKLESIELLGGTTRVPIVKEIIEKILKDDDNIGLESYKKIVGSRINGDDSSVLAASKLGFYLNLKNIAENKLGRTYFKLNSLKDYRYFIDLYSVKFSDNESDFNEEYSDFEKKSERNILLSNHTLYDYDFNSRNSNLKLSLNLNNLDCIEIILYESQKLEQKNGNTINKNDEKSTKIKTIKTFKILDINNFNIEIEDLNCSSKTIDINFHFTQTNELQIQTAVVKCEYPIFLNFNITQSFTSFYDSFKNEIEEKKDLKLGKSKSNKNENIFQSKLMKFVDDYFGKSNIKPFYSKNLVKPLKSEEIKETLEILYPSNITDYFRELLHNKNLNTSNSTIETDEFEITNSTDNNTNLKSNHNEQNSTENEILISSMEDRIKLIKNKTEAFLRGIGSSKNESKDKALSHTFNYYIQNNKTLLDTDYIYIKEILEIDKQYELKAQAKNRLETFIYDIKEKIENNSLNKDGLEYEFDIFVNKMKEISEWYEEHSWESNYSDFKDRIDELENLYDPIKSYNEGFKKLEIMYDDFEILIKNLENSYYKLLEIKDFIRFFSSKFSEKIGLGKQLLENKINISNKSKTDNSTNNSSEDNLTKTNNSNSIKLMDDNCKIIIDKIESLKKDITNEYAKLEKMDKPQPFKKNTNIKMKDILEKKRIFTEDI